MVAGGTMTKRWVLLFALFAAFAPLKSYRAFAQEPPCPPYPECRRSRHFTACSEAIEGKSLLTMRVSDVSWGRCPGRKSSLGYGVKQKGVSPPSASSTGNLFVNLLSV